MSGWIWRKIVGCDLPQMLDELNPQMKNLEPLLRGDRPAMMSGFPKHHGAVVSNTTVTVGAVTTETDLKSLLIERGTIGSKGGFRVMAAGTCGGGTSAKTIRLYFGGVLIASIAMEINDRTWRFDAEFWNADSTQEQKVVVKTWENTGMETMAVTTSSVDTL